MARTIPEILIASRIHARTHLLANTETRHIKTMISIGAPRDEKPEGFARVAARLRLEFEDTTDPMFELSPTREHIGRIIEFSATIATEGGACLIHCEAGISRSTAAAIIVLAALLGPGEESAALAEVLRKAPHAHPNRLMVSYADELLARKGALLDPVERHLRSWATGL